jgi:transcription termination/antitermination protein NusA
MQGDSPHALFMHVLGVPEQVAQALCACGHTSIEEIAYVPAAELMATPGVPPWLLLEIRERARRHLMKDH